MVSQQRISHKNRNQNRQRSIEQPKEQTKETQRIEPNKPETKNQKKLKHRSVVLQLVTIVLQYALVIALAIAFNCLRLPTTITLQLRVV